MSSFLNGSLPSSICLLEKLETLQITPANDIDKYPEYAMEIALPNCIGNLTHLRSLILNIPRFHGTIPESFSQLTLLENLFLSMPSADQITPNDLAVTFPARFDQLVRLKWMKFSNLHLVGFSRQSNFQWQQLEEISFNGCPNLYADMNHLLNGYSGLVKFVSQNTPLAGSLNWLSNLPQLQYFSSEASKMTGSWPTSFWSTSTKLQYLGAVMPSVSLEIPPSIGLMTHLLDIRIEDVQITQPLPANISECTSLRTLVLKSTHMPGPLPDTWHMFMMIQAIKIEGSLSLGELPSSLGRLMGLRTLEIVGSGLNGTIPESLVDLNFHLINLALNSIEGSIPDIKCADCIFMQNKLVGAVPNYMQHHAHELWLSHNSLGPTPPASLGFLADPSRGLQIRLDNNLFSGHLPNVPAASTFTSQLMFSNNAFSGSIPSNYSTYDLDLSHNILSSFLDTFLVEFKASGLLLDDNKFQGTLPDLSHIQNLLQLRVSRNELHGNLPALPSRLMDFAATDNQFSGPLSAEFISSVQSSSWIVSLDVSGNLLECPEVPLRLSSLLASSLRYLSLSRNRFNCDFWNGQDSLLLIGLDLSHNEFTDSRWPPILPNLVNLNLANNSMTGRLDLRKQYTPSITQVDVSDNQFVGDISLYNDLPFLISLDLHNNLFSGALRPEKLPRLQFLNVSGNLLDIKPDLHAIGLLFKQSLQVLSLTSNSHIPRYDNAAFDWRLSGLGRLNSSKPSPTLAGVVCYDVSFYNLTGRTFEFDEDLFMYHQCDCDAQHVGTPPQFCNQCPRESISPERFASAQIASSVQLSQLATEIGEIICGGQVLAKPRGSFVTAHPSPTDPSHFALATQSCWYTPQQHLTRSSNCQGGVLKGHELTSKNMSVIERILDGQCAPGSEGRLCSRCICDERGIDGCWFERASSICAKCSRVFRVSQSIPLFIGLLLLAFIVVSILFFFVLRSKRTQRTTDWAKLPLALRLFYRVVYLISLGHVSILITFVQMLLEITHWDAYAMGVFALLNGKTESIGMRCFWPFLFSSPFLSLLIHLFIPALGIIFVGCATLAAHSVSKFFTFRQASKVARLPLSLQEDLDGDLVIGSEDDTTLGASIGVNNDFSRSTDLYASIGADWQPLLSQTQSNALKVSYPSMALFTSVSISVLKFFYFGAALSAHKYLIPTTDPHTHVKYLQNDPWLKYADSGPLFYTSIPALFVYDLAIPLAFIIIAWKVRHTFQTHRVQIYFGSLFEVFDSKCFWWEIVNIFKKLSIAVVLRALPASSAFQSSLAVSFIAGCMIIQVSLQPWKRKSENIADTTASALLIFALLSSRSGAQLTDSIGSVYYSFALSLAFVISSVLAIAVQTWKGTTLYEKRLSMHLQALGNKASASSVSLSTVNAAEDEAYASNTSNAEHSDFLD